MDSIQVRASNMPQTSAHTVINFSDTISGGSLIASKTYDFVVPRGTIVDKAVVLFKTQFNTGTSASLTIGDVTTGDAILAATNLKTQTANSLVESPVAKRFHTVQASTDGDTNESVYVVRYTIASAGSVPSTGQMIIWFDFRFDPDTAYVTKTYGETSITEV